MNAILILLSVCTAIPFGLWQWDYFAGTFMCFAIYSFGTIVEYLLIPPPPR
jgi:hypothetical protein